MKKFCKNSRFLFLVLITGVTASFISGCADKEIIGTNGAANNLVEAKVITPTRMLAPVNSNINSAFTGIKNSFLITSGNTQYFKESLSVSGKDYFWRQALDILMVEDIYKFADGSSTNQTLINNLLNTFLQQNQGSGGLYDWNWNEFNDDLAWAGLAFIRGYQITGNTIFRTQAKYAFDRIYSRGWSTDLGGGIWWDIRKNEKSGLSNNPTADLACYLYDSGLGQGYLDKANAILNWVWSNLRQSNGSVWEKKDKNGVVSGDGNVYNVGAFISAANHINRTKGGASSWYNDCINSIDYVKNNKTWSGIIANTNRDGTWASEYARGIREFLNDHSNMWPTYYPWMKQNADMIWSKRRTDRNLIWNQWDQQTPSDNVMSTVECVSAVVMLAATPATQP